MLNSVLTGHRHVQFVLMSIETFTHHSPTLLASGWRRSSDRFAFWACLIKVWKPRSVGDASVVNRLNRL